MANVISIDTVARTDAAVAKLNQARAAVTRLSGAAATVAPAAASAIRPLEGMAASAIAFGPAALGLAAAAGALAGFSRAAQDAFASLRETASQAEQLDNLAQKSGVAASSLAGLQLAFKEAGVPAEALNTGLRFLNRSISEGDPALRALGITTKDTREALFQLAEQFRKAPDGADKTAVAVKVLGRAGSELIPVLNKGGVALRGFVDDMVRTGAVFGEDTIKRLRDVDDQFDRMERTILRLRVAFVTAALPAMQKVLDLSEALAQAILQRLAVALEATSLVLAQLAGRMGLVVPGIREFHQAAEGIQGALKTMREEVRKTAEQPGPITPERQREIEAGAAAMRKAAQATKKAKADFEAYVRSVQANVRVLDFESLTRRPAVKPEALRPGREVTEFSGGPSRRRTRFEETPAPVPELKLSPAIQQAEEFKALLASVADASVSSVELMRGAFETLSSSLSGFFEVALTDIHKLGAAVVAVVRQMVADILASLARLALVRAFNFLLKAAGFALGGPAGAGAAAAVSGVAGGPSSILSAGAAGPGVSALEDLTKAVADLSRSVAGSGSVVQVQALDSKSFDEFLNSPAGQGKIAEMQRGRRSGI